MRDITNPAIKALTENRYVILLYRPALARITTDRESGYPTEELGIAIIAKQRNGETGNVYFRHNSAMTKITEYVPPLEYMLKHAK